MNKPVAVIGAGLGGLTAAVTLAARGNRVALFEKEPRAGGYAISFSRKGHLFDLALHALAAGGEGEDFKRLADRLGIGERIKFIRLPEGFRVFLGDDEFRLPNGGHPLRVKLMELFPGERRGLGRLYADSAKYLRAYMPMFDERVSLLAALPRFIPRLPTFLKHGNQSTKDFLDGYTRDPHLRALLFQPAIFMGIPAAEFPAVNYLMLFGYIYGMGLYSIAGGGQALTDALLERFLALGGELRLRTQVTGILAEKGRVTGVATQGGTQEVSAAVSGASLITTVNDLVGREGFPKRYLDILDRQGKSVSVLALNLGLDRAPREVGIDTHITIAFPEPDLDKCLYEQETTGKIGGYSVTAHGNSDPDLPPEASRSVSLVTGAPACKWFGLDRGAYLEEKKKTLALCMDLMEKRFPGVSSRVEVADISTPVTMGRYTGNPDGAIMGFSCRPGEHRNLLGLGRPPVKGLYLAGAWTDKLGGMMQAMKAGEAAAQRVARK